MDAALITDSVWSNDPFQTLRISLNVPFIRIQFFQLVGSYEFIVWEKNSNYVECNLRC